MSTPLLRNYLSEDAWLDKVLSMIHLRMTDPVSLAHVGRMDEWEKKRLAELEAARPYLTLPWVADRG